jgi:HTH-type transcriptional regulator/antitoxin HigA
MIIRPIRSKADHAAALKDIAALMRTDPAPGTPKGDRLEVLATLVEAYERAHFPIDPPDAVEAIKFRMEQQGLTARDLAPMIGRTNRVYEVLARRRLLTMAMVRRLHEQLGIPAASLIGTAEVEGTGSVRARIRRAA